MNMEQEHKRTAWLDGELSASEAAAFLAELSDAERHELEQEKHLNEGIASLLRADAPCPLSAWKRATAAVYEAEAAQTRTRFQWRKAALIAAPIAAVLLVVLMLAVPSTTDATPTFLKLAGATVPELEHYSSVQPERDQVDQLLRQYGFNLSLDEISVPAHEEAQGRTLRLIGASTATYRGETVVVLLFACCNKPTQVVITARGGEAERAVREAMERKSVLMARELCPQYMGAVVGDTDRAGLLLALLRVSE